MMIKIIHQDLYMSIQQFISFFFETFKVVDVGLPAGLQREADRRLGTIQLGYVEVHVLLEVEMAGCRPVSLQKTESGPGDDAVGRVFPQHDRTFVRR